MVLDRKVAGVICSVCGALRNHAPHCKRCKGSGRVPVDEALLKELRTRVICVSGAEVEALLNKIDSLRNELKRIAEFQCLTEEHPFTPEEAVTKMQIIADEALE